MLVSWLNLKFCLIIHIVYLSSSSELLILIYQILNRYNSLFVIMNVHFHYIILKNNCAGALSVMSDSSRPYGLEPVRLLCPQDFQVRILECYHFLLQKIFPIQRSNPCLLLGQADALPLSYLGISTK